MPFSEVGPELARSLYEQVHRRHVLRSCIDGSLWFTRFFDSEGSALEILDPRDYVVAIQDGVERPLTEEEERELFAERRQRVWVSASVWYPLLKVYDVHIKRAPAHVRPRANNARKNENYLLGTQRILGIANCPTFIDLPCLPCLDR